MEQTIEKNINQEELDWFPLQAGFDFSPDSSPKVKTPVQVKKDREEVKSLGIIREFPDGTVLEIHPAANLLPMQTKEDYVPMKESIRRSGQTDPIELLNGRILDGRNRYKACLELGIPIKVVDVSIKEEGAVSYVYSRNLHRRHLNKGQLAVMALKFLPEEQKKSKERQLDALKQALVRPKIGLKRKGDAATIIGKKVGVGRQYIKYAIAVQKKKPELLEKVFSGEMELTKAYSEAKKTAVPVVNNWLKPEQVLEIILNQLPEEKNCILAELAKQTNGRIKQALLNRARRESVRLLDEKIDEIGGVE